MVSRSLSWLTPEVRRIQAEHMARLEQLYRTGWAGRVVSVCGPCCGQHHGLRGTNGIDMLARPQEWLEHTLSDMARRVAEAADPVNFRPLYLELDCLGVHYVDALLGARVYFHEAQAWNDPLPCDLADLRMPDLSRSQVFQASLRLVRLAAAATRGLMPIAIPVTSCPINIGINLFGDRLLEAMLARPGAARHALRVITDVIVAALRELTAALPEAIWRPPVVSSRCAPSGHGYIDGCATQLVSRRHYEEFLAPLDAEILAVFPRGGQIHLCGACTQHIPTWRGMGNLASVQLNDRAAEDFEAYFAALRPDQIVYVAPTPTMTLDRILTISAGRRIVCQAPLDTENGVESN